MHMPVQSDTHQDISKPEYITQGFITFLREMGVEVPISSSITFFQSLAYVTISNRNDVYWAVDQLLLGHLRTYQPTMRLSMRFGKTT